MSCCYIGSSSSFVLFRLVVKLGQQSGLGFGALQMGGRMRRRMEMFKQVDRDVCGCTQRIASAVNDKIGLEPAP